MSHRLLLLDDEVSIRRSFQTYLERVGFDVTPAKDTSEARGLIDVKLFDVAILDLRLPDGSGMDLIEDLRTANPAMVIIMITAHGDIPLAVEAMSKGADNFLSKPVELKDLTGLVTKSLELGSRQAAQRASRQLAKQSELFIGTTPPFRETMHLVETAMANDSPVVLLGESGTGKGMMAKRIHEGSTRASKPFVELNCSSLGGELLSSELFGHARGAFTSAIQNRSGLLDIADGGTLFLDEIGDMDLAIQAKLLKVIEEKTYRRIGETRIRTSEFRLLSATNKDLKEEVQKGTFRQDLYYRIFVFPITLPSLRDMPGDIEDLVRHMMGTIGVSPELVSADAMAALVRYHWPGNIRELRNVLERAVLLSRGGTIGTAHLPGLGDELPTDVEPMEGMSLEELEARHIRATLHANGGDVSKTAEALGISRPTLYRKLSKFKIARP